MRLNTNSIRGYYISVDESRFFFSKTIVSFLKKCEIDSESFLMAISEKEYVKDDRFREHAEQIGKLVKVLRDDYAALPAKFENDLRIES